MYKPIPKSCPSSRRGTLTSESTLVAPENGNGIGIGMGSPTGIELGTGFVGSSTESKRSLAEHVKHVELQRDMLRQTVAKLLERQELQERRHEKRIRLLELEVERLRAQWSSRSSVYRDFQAPKEMLSLQDEIESLRQRIQTAEEEKVKTGDELKLSRSAFETACQERDSLEQQRLLMEHGGANAEGGDNDADTPRQAQAHDDDDEQYKQQQRQLETNAELCSGLRITIEQAEEKQQTTEILIYELNTKLAALEPFLEQAQRRSEDERLTQEQEREMLRQNHHKRLKRALRTSKSSDDHALSGGAGTGQGGRPCLSVLRSPTYPPPALANGDARDHQPSLLSPKLRRASSSSSNVASTATTATTASEPDNAYLLSRVRELEQALKGADEELQLVVGRMNQAQIEVLELQHDRDYALRRMRQLQEQNKPKKPQPQRVQTQHVNVQAKEPAQPTPAETPVEPKRPATPVDEGIYYE